MFFIKNTRVHISVWILGIVTKISLSFPQLIQIIFSEDINTRKCLTSV
jgi:hypothetical protein